MVPRHHEANCFIPLSIQQPFHRYIGLVGWIAATNLYGALIVDTLSLVCLLIGTVDILIAMVCGFGANLRCYTL